MTLKQLAVWFWLSIVINIALNYRVHVRECADTAGRGRVLLVEGNKSERRCVMEEGRTCAVNEGLLLSTFSVNFTKGSIIGKM